MRRARGCGGRFLNTKKNDGNTDNTTNPGATLPVSLPKSSPSEAPPSGCSENQITANQMQQPAYTNGTDGYPQSGFQLSAFHAMQGERIDEGDCSGQQRGGILVNQSSNRAVTIQWMHFPIGHGLSLLLHCPGTGSCLFTWLLMSVQSSETWACLAERGIHWYIWCSKAIHSWLVSLFWGLLFSL